MNIVDKFYRFIRWEMMAWTTVHSRNCVGHIHKDFIGFVVQVSRSYMSEEVYFSKRFLFHSNARNCAVAMTEAISKLRQTEKVVQGISKDLLVQSYRLRFLQKVLKLLFPLTTKFYY